MLSLNTVILAAGQGTRLKLPLPKVLAPLSGQAMLDFPLFAVEAFLTSRKLKSPIGVVLGYQKEKIQEHLQKLKLKNPVITAIQNEQKGTAHALQCFFDQIPEAAGRDYTLVMCGDTPLIREQELNELYEAIENDKSLLGVAASFETPTPQGLGRIVRSGNSFQIVEQKEATPEQLEIQEVNSGLYLVKTSFVLKHLKEIKESKKGKEFYLTDLFRPERAVKAVLFPEGPRFQGVNTLQELSVAQGNLWLDKVQKLVDRGVRVLDPLTTYVDYAVQVGEGSTLYPQVSLRGTSRLGSGVVVDVGSVIENSEVGDLSSIRPYTYLTDSKIGKSVSVGPFAHLRPGTELGDGVKVGNFVEIKNSQLKEGVKVSHLSYVGDAEIGENSNIGCGFITCNYDGAQKHKTKIGKNTFIGSDSQVIAPLEIGQDCYVASGSTINKDMADGDFAISRMKQTTLPGGAKKFLKKK